MATVPSQVAGTGSAGGKKEEELMKCLKTIYAVPRRRKVIKTIYDFIHSHEVIKTIYDFICSKKVIKTIYDLVHSRKAAKAIYDLAPLVLIGWITSYKALPVGEQIAAVVGMHIFSRVVLEEVVALVEH